jgi:hypothetical protein
MLSFQQLSFERMVLYKHGKKGAEGQKAGSSGRSKSDLSIILSAKRLGYTMSIVLQKFECTSSACDGRDKF